MALRRNLSILRVTIWMELQTEVWRCVHRALREKNRRLSPGAGSGACEAEVRGWPCTCSGFFQLKEATYANNR